MKLTKTVKTMLAVALCAVGLSAMAGKMTNVPYVDKDGVEQKVAGAQVIDSSTTQFKDGGWYVVTGDVTVPASIYIYSGTANLILADGATLTAGFIDYDPWGGAGIEVVMGTTLNIYAQVGGTGALVAQGTQGMAGIGGNMDINPGCGTVNIYGGRVTAMGGAGAAGIGGGYNGAGGTITIAGGTVIASGDATMGASDIGPGAYYYNGAEVTITGGSLIAPDIWGPAKDGAGSAVHLVSVELVGTGHERLTIEGLGNYGVRDIFPYVRPGETTENVFFFLPNGEYAFKIGRANYTAKVNGVTTAAKLVSVDPEQPTTATVTFGRELVHMTAAWTSGDGTVTNAINGTSFEVSTGTTGVKVIFTPEDRYGLDKTEYAFAEAITADCEIPAEDLPTATYLYVTVTVGQLVHLTAAWTSGDGTVTNAINGTSFEVSTGTTGVKVIFTPGHNYQFVDVNEIGIRELDSPLEMDCEVTPPQVEGIPGTVMNPWNVGDAVTAYMGDEGTLVIGGTGAMDDFADATEVPWATVAKDLSAVTVANGVTYIGKNAFAGIADTVTVNGTPLSFHDMVAGARGLADPVVPDDKVLVSKTELQAAGAETVTVEGGAVTLGVTVNTNGDFTAETKDWSPVELKGENVKVENGKVVITIPVDSQSGFMILQSGDAKIAE